MRDCLSSAKRTTWATWTLGIATALAIIGAITWFFTNFPTLKAGTVGFFFLLAILTFALRWGRGVAVVAAGFGDTLRQPFGDLLALGMDRHGQTELRRLPHSFVQRQIVGARKLRETGIAQECFETHHAALREIGQFAAVSRDEASP